MKAEEISRVTRGKWYGPVVQDDLKSFSNDTRTLKKGDIFLALKGEGVDGHAFLESAQKNGAAGAIVQEYDDAITLPQLKVSDVLEAFHVIAHRHREQYSGKLVGVTGSCGKTSTREMLRSFFGLPKTPVNRINWNNLLGVPLNLMELELVGQQYGVIEAGMDRVGEMDKLAKMIEPDCAIVTNVYPQHMNNLGSIEAIAEEKAKLARATRKGGTIFTTNSAWEQAAFRELQDNICVIAREDEVVTDISPERVIRYRYTKKKAGLGVDIMSADLGHVSFLLKPMIRGMVANMVLAIAAGRYLGVFEKKIQDALSLWKPLYLRGETVTIGDRYYYVDCYNNLPVALDESLEMFTEFAPTEHPRLYVLGGIAGVGSISEAAHYDIGKKVPLRENDSVVLIGKETMFTRKALEERGYGAPKVAFYENTEMAREAVSQFEGSVFLKGSRVYQLENLLPKRQDER